MTADNKTTPNGVLQKIYCSLLRLDRRQQEMFDDIERVLFASNNHKNTCLLVQQKTTAYCSELNRQLHNIANDLFCHYDIVDNDDFWDDDYPFP